MSLPTEARGRRDRSSYLVDGDRYERAMHGWVDAGERETFVATVQLVDPWVGVELVAETTPSPTYAIRAARGRVLVDPGGRVDPAVAAAMPGLAGLTMAAGFTRATAQVAGVRPGAAYFVDAAIEIARLARQVARLPAATVARHWAEGPVGLWRLDRQGWTDLPGSCYTYRDESEALFAERAVATSMPRALYDPAAGAARVFNRAKVARLERRADGIWLSHSMFDEAHSFQIWLVVADAGATGPVIVDAGSRTPRLPYGGICSDPQERIRALVGQPVDADLRKRLGAIVGGPAGCAQLYDLTADLVKLLLY
jgi:hypothetical protein